MLRFSRWQDLILPIGIISSILVILVPLPAGVMDLLLAANITIGVIILLTTIYVKTPLEFSIFPSLLLATTLGRLVLNIATTRLILTQAESQRLYAAGGVIKSFGEFVAGDKLVVGFTIFVIIIVIQFVVITKGATRISEVAARFALDGMPGRQMAIDADLNAGVIDEQEAQARRAEVTLQADFYGAMDGASKFVRGDAVAGVMITLVNVVGGLLIGMTEFGMTLGEAASLFTKLTIGDGLVSQVPALLISLAAALLVTRSTQRINLPTQFLQQLFSRPQALVVAAGFAGMLIFTTLPFFPLLVIASSCLGLAFVIDRQQGTRDEAAAAEAQAQAEKKPEARIEDFLAIDPMELEIGVALIRLADPSRGGDLLTRITNVRQAVAGEIGIVLPKVRIRDNMRLGDRQYRIKIANNIVAQGTVHPDRLLAIAGGPVTGTLEGEESRDPTFGRAAVWIEPGDLERATAFGYTPMEPVAVLVAHLRDVVHQYADELLTRDACKRLVDELKASSPAVVDELIPGQLKLGEVQQVLQMLLREQVPIRQLGTILEALGDYAARTTDVVWLTEQVRHRLARTISSRFRDTSGRLRVVTLDPALEDRIAAGVEQTEQGWTIRLSPAVQEMACRQVGVEVAKLAEQNLPQVVLVSPQIRSAVKKLTRVDLPQLVVLSYNEITRDTTIESVGLVTDAH